MNILGWVLPGWTKWAFLGLLAAAAFAFGVYLSHLRHEAARAKTLEETNIALQASAALQSEALLQYGKDLAAERAKADKLKGDLDAEIRSNRVYGDCLVPANGVSIYNRALTPAR